MGAGGDVKKSLSPLTEGRRIVRDRGSYSETAPEQYRFADLERDLPEEAEAFRRDVPGYEMATIGVKDHHGPLVAWVPKGRQSADWYSYDAHTKAWVAKSV